MDRQLYCVYHFECVDSGDRECLLAAPAFKNWLAFSEGMKGDYAGNVTKSLTEGFGQFVS